MKRTFSEIGRFSTGLPGLQTCEAGSQDFGDFGYSLVAVEISHSATAYRAFTDRGLLVASHVASHASISCR